MADGDFSAFMSVSEAKMGRNGYASYRCPVHSGKSSTSAWVKEFENGVVAKCRGCGAQTKEIFAAFGLPPPKWKKQDSGSTGEGQQDAGVPVRKEYVPPSEKLRRALRREVGLLVEAYRDIEVWKRMFAKSEQNGGVNAGTDNKHTAEEFYAAVRESISEEHTGRTDMADKLDGQVGVLLPNIDFVSFPPPPLPPNSWAVAYPIVFPKISSGPASAKFVLAVTAEDGYTEKKKWNVPGLPLPPVGLFRPSGWEPGSGRIETLFVTEGEGNAAAIAAAGHHAASSGGAHNLAASAGFLANSLRGKNNWQVLFLKDSDSVGSSSVSYMVMEHFTGSVHRSFSHLRDTEERIAYDTAGINDARDLAVTEGLDSLRKELDRLAEELTESRGNYTQYLRKPAACLIL